MPTGYTVGIENGEITTAKDFLILCLRAFGVCIEMRDDPFTKPIPEKFEPSDYYSRFVKRAQSDIDNLLGTTDEDLYVKMLNDKNENLLRCQKMIKENTAKKKRYLIILDQIRGWNPPKEYSEVKKFATEQIVMSMEQLDNTYYEKEIDELSSSTMSIGEYRAMLLDSLNSSLSYATKSLQSDIDNTEKKNEFLKGFRESIAKL